MKKRQKLLILTCLLFLFMTSMVSAYYWPPTNVPPGSPPNYTQIDTTYFFGTPSLPPAENGGIYIWYDQGKWQIANHIYSSGYSLEQFHCAVLVCLEQPPTPGVNVFAEGFELISDTSKTSQCYRQNDRWGWKHWGADLYEIWWDVCTREWKNGAGDPDDFMKLIIAGSAVDFNFWSSGHNDPFDAGQIYLGSTKTTLSTIPGYYDYFSGISDPYQSQAGTDPANDPNVTIFTQKDTTSKTYNLNGLINPADSYFCDSYFPYGDYGSRYSGTYTYEGNGVQFSTKGGCLFPNLPPHIELPEDSILSICTGDSVCISIFASDPNPEDTITVEKVLGAGSYTSITDLTPIYDTLCFIPDTSGVYEFIFKVTDQHGATDYDTAYYTITLNSPPTVIAPDNNEFLCNPDDSVNFDVSATDPNTGQNLTLEKISGPGSFATVNGTSPLSGTQKWAPATVGTYNFVYRVTDKCGEVDYDTATWVITFNNPPAVTAPDSSLFLCNPDTISFDVTGTDPNAGDTLTLELVSGPGTFPTTTGLSSLTGTLKYYVTATGTYSFIFKVTDKCGLVDYDTATWFVVKDATTPVVTAPDSNKTFCGPDTIRFTVSATDANPYDTLKLFKYSGPGTFYPDTARGNPPLSGELKYYVTASGTYNFIFKAMDKCGRYNFDTATYVITMNNPPVVTASDSAKSFCGPDTIRFTVTATDPNSGDTLTLSGPGIPTPIKGLSPLSANIKIYISSAGTHNYVYTVTDKCNITDKDTSTWTITMNNPPVVIAPDSSKSFCGPDTIRFTVTATDPNPGDSLTLSGPGIASPIKGLSPLSANVKFYISSAGTYNYIYTVNDKCNITDVDTATYVITMNNPPVVTAPDSNKYFCNPDTIRFTVTGTDSDPNDTLKLELVSSSGIFPTIIGPSPVTGTLKHYVVATGTYTFIFKVTDKCGLVDYDTATWFVIKDSSYIPVVTAPDSIKTLCGPDTIRFTVTATDGNPYDTLKLYKYSGPGTFYPDTAKGNPPVSGTLKYYVTDSGTYNFIFKAMDKCGRYDFDTATYVITMNNPPVVTAPDSTKSFCGPDTIRFTVTATDPDAGDSLTLSGPGIAAPIKGLSPLSANVKFYISSAETYNYIYQVANHCGYIDYDTATWIITMNNPPVVSAPDSTKSFCGPDTIRFTVTATDPDAGDSLTLSGPGIAAPIKGLSPLSANVKFYISSAGTYNYIYQVANHCGYIDYDTATWIVKVNSPPVVSAPDSTKSFCGPDTIRFTVTATDPDAGDSLTLSGPGIAAPVKGLSPLSANVKFYISSAGTYDYFYTLTDKCNISDVDTATYVIIMNNPPVVTASDSAKSFCGPDTIRFTVTAIDPDAGDSLTLSGPGIAVPIKGLSPLSANVKFYISSAGTYNYIYQVANHCGYIDYDTATWVVKVNSPPTLNLPETIIACTGDTARFTVTGDDPDKDYNITLEKLTGVGNFTNLNGKPPLSGNWWWVPSDADLLSNPHQVIFKVTDNCGLSVTDTVSVIVQDCACDIYVEIGNVDCANPGDTVSVPVLLKTSVTLGGFDLRIEFDPTVLYFLSVTRGDGLTSDWEYFTYRQLPCPMCGCCKYKLLLLGIYDIKDAHAGVPLEASSEYIEIARLKFRIANDNNLRGFFVNICFEWDEGICTQNTFSDPTGYILYVSSDPDEFSYAECDTQLHEGNQVLNNICFERCGGIKICTTGEKVVGDINLNLIPYDPADLTLFASYFIYGEDVFLSDPYWRSVQISNTDVNRDGFALSLSDFIYMIRIMLHDASPIPKLTSEESRLAVLLTVRESDYSINFNSEIPIGAALLIFKSNGTIGKPRLSVSQMEMDYGMPAGDEFRVLVFSSAGNSISSGNNEILNIKAEDELELISVEAVDSYGRSLTASITNKAIPEQFTLNPNYPNPFNPETNISFALPEDLRVSLKIYNLSGQLVKTLIDETLSAGAYTIHWDGTSNSKDVVASGIYFYKLTAGSYSQTRKMCLMK